MHAHPTNTRLVAGWTLGCLIRPIAGRIRHLPRSTHGESPGMTRSFAFRGEDAADCFGAPWPAAGGPGGRGVLVRPRFLAGPDSRLPAGARDRPLAQVAGLPPGGQRPAG